MTFPSNWLLAPVGVTACPGAIERSKGMVWSLFKWLVFELLATDGCLRHQTAS